VSLFKRDTLVEQLAKTTGWPIAESCGDAYTLRSPDPGVVRHVWVRHQQGNSFMKFSATFPVRFPLDRTPDGLYGRLLLRSMNLNWCNWLMEIADNCQAQPFLWGMWPTVVVTPEFFQTVCNEMVGEIRDFHAELRDKFQYGGNAAGAAAWPTGHAGVPQIVPGGGIRYIK
jgi:hypothetical protein